MHDRDTVRHGEGFLLVMGDEKGGHPEPAQKLGQFLLEALPDLAVESPQRLIQEHDAWLYRQSTRRCYALALSARELRDRAFFEAGEPHQLQP
jgi:hypothetical protein